MPYVYGDLERQQRERQLANMQMAALASELAHQDWLRDIQRQQALKELEARDQDRQHELRQRMLSEMVDGGVSGSPDGRSRSSATDLRMQALAALMDDPSLRQVRKYIDVNNPERKADLGKEEDGPLTIDIQLNPKWVDAYRKARTEAMEKMFGQRAAPSPSTPPPSALADYNERLATVLSAKKDMEDALARTKPLISTWGNFDSTDLKNEQDAARRKYEQALKGFEAMAPGFRASGVPVDDTLARLRGENAGESGSRSDAPAERGGHGIEISVEPEKPAPKAATGGKRLRVLTSGERILATDEELEEFRKSSPARRRELLKKLKAD